MQGRLNGINIRTYEDLLGGIMKSHSADMGDFGLDLRAVRGRRLRRGRVLLLHTSPPTELRAVCCGQKHTLCRLTASKSQLHCSLAV